MWMNDLENMRSSLCLLWMWTSQKILEGQHSQMLSECLCIEIIKTAAEFFTQN